MTKFKSIVRRWVKASSLFIVFLSLIVVGCSGDGTDKKANTGKLNYPTKAVNLIVPYAAGGSSDLSARPFADEMGNILKQPMVIINRPGAGGGIGAAEVARAKPDGYTLLNASIGNVTIVPYTSNVGYDYTSFRGVAQMTDIPLALTVRADSQIKNVKDFIDYVEANPGKMRYGTPGAGNIQHVAIEGWAHKMGINITHMPFEGANPAIAALIGGHVDACFTGVTEASPHHKSDVLRIIGITSADRISLVDAPTFKEQGYDLISGVWYGVLAPKDTPDEIVNFLAGELKKAYDNPKVQDAWEKLFLIPSYLGPAELDERIKQEAEINQQILKDLGIYKK